MSVRVLAQVWDHFPGGGSELLALLAMADWSDDEGRCWPSMVAIATKTRLSRSQAQRVVHGLIADGYLHVMGNADGGKPGSTRQYRINLGALTGRTGATHPDTSGNAETGSANATPTGRMDATGSAHATGRTDAQEGPHGCDKRGRTGATLTVSEPSTTVRESARADARPTPRPAADKPKNQPITFDTFAERKKAAGEKLIAEDDPIFGWAEGAGIPDDWLHLAWTEFSSRYRGNAKRYADWPQTFRNAVRSNWYEFWRVGTDGALALTTKGELARRAAESVKRTRQEMAA